MMTPKRFPSVLPFLPGVMELPRSFGVPSLVLVRKMSKADLRESPSRRYTHASHCVVLLTDALSLLQALQSNWDSNWDTDHKDLSAALASLCRSHAVTLQWISSHYNMPGNEAADSLARRAQQKSTWIDLPATLR